MGVNRAFMTQGAPGPCGFAGVTLQAVILPPTRIVALGPGFLMAGDTEIRLVTNETLGPVPGRLNPMSLQPPEVIVRGRLGDLVTFAAGGLCMTNRAGLLILSSQDAMTLRPAEFMACRRRFRIHIHMTRGTVRSRTVRLVADLKLGLAIHQGNQR